MPDSTSHIYPEDRLDLLRAADPSRKWRSLDDRRICVLCDRVISGRQVMITRDANGAVKVACPTSDCAGSPREWVYPGNPLVSDKAWADWAMALAFGESEFEQSRLQPAIVRTND